MLNVISLGAGVQSSTMALMAACGEITPMPDCAIFADTGAEPLGVYAWLDWLETQLPFPVHRVSAGNLRDHILKRMNLEVKHMHARPPFFVEGGGMLRRQCTGEFKIIPIQRKLRELVGLRRGQRGPKEVVVSQWIGISLDEAQRMKPAQWGFIRNRWPLIETGMSRAKCLEWMRVNGYDKPTKSACTFCPYHDDALWREMKRDDPVSFADAVALDAAIRPGMDSIREGFNAPRELFLHRSRKPLDEVDFSNASDMGQGDMFGDECEGMCGV